MKTDGDVTISKKKFVMNKKKEHDEIQGYLKERAALCS